MQLWCVWIDFCLAMRLIEKKFNATFDPRRVAKNYRQRRGGGVSLCRLQFYWRQRVQWIVWKSQMMYDPVFKWNCYHFSLAAGAWISISISCSLNITWCCLQEMSFSMAALCWRSCFCAIDAAFFDIRFLFSLHIIGCPITHSRTCLSLLIRFVFLTLRARLSVQTGLSSERKTPNWCTCGASFVWSTTSLPFNLIRFFVCFIQFLHVPSLGIVYSPAAQMSFRWKQLANGIALCWSLDISYRHSIYLWSVLMMMSYFTDSIIKYCSFLRRPRCGKCFQFCKIATAEWHNLSNAKPADHIFLAQSPNWLSKIGHFVY